jgi:hypothetical protein
MKTTHDYLDNIVDLVHACRKVNKKIGARLQHFYLNENTIRIKLTGNAFLTIPVMIVEHGVSQVDSEALKGIIDTYEVDKSLESQSGVSRMTVGEKGFSYFGSFFHLT